MLTKAQEKVLREIAANSKTKGVKQLNHFLWLNTTEPKWPVGTLLKVSDPGHRVYGYPVKDFTAKVVKHSAFITDEEWHYELDCVVKCAGKKDMYLKLYSRESDLSISNNKDNIVVLSEAKSEHSDEMVLSLNDLK